MKWFNKKILPKIFNKTWSIYLRPFGEFQIIELTDDPSFVWVSIYSLYMEFLIDSLSSYEVIYLSQYIDQNQDMLKKPEELLKNLRNSYSLEIKSTTSFSSPKPLGLEDKEFILNISGRPNMHWIDKIIRFGGASLPNIIYGVNEPIEDWFEKILSWNSIFYDWYRLKRPNAEIIRIRQEIPFLFWTSDIHMNFLVDEKQEDALLTSAKELAKEKNLILNIKNVA